MSTPRSTTAAFVMIASLAVAPSAYAACGSDVADILVVDPGTGPQTLHIPRSERMAGTVVPLGQGVTLRFLEAKTVQYRHTTAL